MGWAGLWLAVAAMAARAQVAVPAKAGLIFYNDGEVRVDGRVVRTAGGRAVRLAAGQTLQTTDGRVELVLQPDNFLRLAIGSAAEMLSDDPAHVRLRVRGEAVLESTVAGAVELLCADAAVSVAKPSMFRLNCGPARRLLRVYRGRVEVRGGAAVVARQQLDLGGRGRVAPIAPADFDGFDGWNAARSHLFASTRLRAGKNTLSTSPYPALTDPEEIRRLLYGPPRP